MKSKEIGLLVERIMDKKFNVVEEISQANSGLSLPQQLGSKALNSLKLRELSVIDGKDFSTPEQITIPMTIPIYIQHQNQTLNS
jgi:hypothetical protein